MIGDVIIAAQAFDADIFNIHNTIANTDFSSALIHPNTDTLTPRFYSADTTLLTLAQSVSHTHNNVSSGIIATSNHFPAPKALFELIKNNHADIIDMESAAIYQYSWLTGIPSLVVRGISNRLNANGDDEDTSCCDIDNSAANAANIIIHCTKQLRRQHLSKSSKIEV
tara:strand:- start:656 stop:1159 length:504 start_codon:yes stop_codon:yes gene_type:complete